MVFHSSRGEGGFRKVRRISNVRKLCALLCVAVLSTSCAPEPRGKLRESEANAITVSINDNWYQQEVLGEMVTGAFVRSGREAYLEAESNSKEKPRISRVQSGEADVVIGCTGEFLHYLNPQLAQEMSEKYVAAKKAGLDPNDGTWRDKVYQAMVGSLPNALMATDPSNAKGCDNYDGPELPQNPVPVFREVALTRQDRITLNTVSGGITTDDLERLYSGDHSPAATRERVDELLSTLTF